MKKKITLIILFSFRLVFIIQPVYLIAGPCEKGFGQYMRDNITNLPGWLFCANGYMFCKVFWEI